MVLLFLAAVQAVQAANQRLAGDSKLCRFKQDYKRDRCELLSVRKTRNDDVYELCG